MLHLERYCLKVVYASGNIQYFYSDIKSQLENLDIILKRDNNVKESKILLNK